jgi:hypothetical protein
MAGTGKPSKVATAAFVVGCGLAVLAPTAAVAQIPFMIPNFNFGPQHYRGGGSQHYSTRHSRHEEGKTPDKSAPAPDKSKERDATQPEPTASTSAQRTQQTSGPPPSRDAAPSGGAETSPPPAPPAKKPADDQPAFAPSR